MNYMNMRKLFNDFKYCPMCGEYLYDDSESANVVWNERDVSELYK